MQPLSIAFWALCLWNSTPAACASIRTGEIIQRDSNVLQYGNTPPGRAVKPGTELRILCIGDSITVGWLSADGNGYREKLRNDLSQDKVVFAGTESGGSMSDGYSAAWSGKQIRYMAEHIGPSLAQRPNVILVHAGTNDMNKNSPYGDDPHDAAVALGKMIDQIITACPDATVLVAMILHTCDQDQESRTVKFQAMIPGVVQQRRDNGHHVLAVDFTSISVNDLRDCIHPTDNGYKLMGDYWYDFMTQIPRDWIQAPVGSDPDRRKEGVNANGGPDSNIPPPDFGTSPVKITSPSVVKKAAALPQNRNGVCKDSPVWGATGEIALGIGHNGDWKFNKNWVKNGKVADGLNRDPKWVRLVDMNGDGKADYLWVNPVNGELRCWINNLPGLWSPAGNNGGIIASGAGVGDSVFFADMNGDGLADYLVVNPNSGAVTVYWNYGPDPNSANGWKFVPGGEIASGVTHANWKTLRFADINGDGRADYVVVGEGGALHLWLNIGQPGTQDLYFSDQGGIASGASPDIDRLVFADMDGDGRDDYLIWDDDGGLTGFLNIRTRKDGMPSYSNQGPAKAIADGISEPYTSIILADLDGDGKDDYAHIDAQGGISLWYNRGSADTSRAMDGLRFADINGDGIDDYVWLDHATGATTMYINKGPSDSDRLGWAWAPLNGGKPNAAGAGPAATVKFGDIDGDGKDDYLVLHPKTGELHAYLNGGENPSNPGVYIWNPIGSIASGLGPGADVRFADIDGDGRDDYIFLHPGGRTTIFRNQFSPNTPNSDWAPMPDADAAGVGHRPEEIDFYDINGDGKADYIWTDPLDGSVTAWLNQYPAKPTWIPKGKIMARVGASGASTRWATLQANKRASYVVVDEDTGAISAWLNGCGNFA